MRTELLGHQEGFGSLLSGGTKVLVVCFMVVVAQRPMRWVVVPEYAGSNPVYHPKASRRPCICESCYSQRVTVHCGWWNLMEFPWIRKSE